MLPRAQVRSTAAGALHPALSCTVAVFGSRTSFVLLALVLFAFDELSHNLLESANFYCLYNHQTRPNQCASWQAGCNQNCVLPIHDGDREEALESG